MSTSRRKPEVARICTMLRHVSSDEQGIEIAARKVGQVV
jgi:hypothetical protein